MEYPVLTLKTILIYRNRLIANTFLPFIQQLVHTCSCWTWQYFFVLWKPRIILSLTKPELYVDQSYDLDPDPADEYHLAYELVDFPLAASDLHSLSMNGIYLLSCMSTTDRRLMLPNSWRSFFRSQSNQAPRPLILILLTKLEQNYLAHQKHK